jgi:hypothetical protein
MPPGILLNAMVSQHSTLSIAVLIPGVMSDISAPVSHEQPVRRTAPASTPNIHPFM